MGVGLGPWLAFALSPAQPSPAPWAANLVDVRGGSANDSILWPHLMPTWVGAPRAPDSPNANHSRLHRHI